MPVLPGAEPFSQDGDDVGVLLCHGFTGSPQSLRPWAEHLAGQGFSVRLPRLPGHGTSLAEMSLTRWPDWYSTVERSLLDLRERCATVVVAGLSMGGALALRLAQEHPGGVSGLVLVNPALKAEDRRLAVLPLLRHAVPSLAGIASDIRKPGVTELAYDRTPLQPLYSLMKLWELIVADLASVTQPVLLLRSAVDHVVPASSSALVLSRISSRDITEMVLPDSFHVATLDHDAPTVFAASTDFVRRLAGAAQTRRSGSRAGTT